MTSYLNEMVLESEKRGEVIGRKEGRREGAIQATVELLKELNTPENNAISYMIKKYNMTTDEAKKAWNDIDNR